MTEPAELIEDALSIEIPSSGHLVLDDTRRLTGPGMLWDRPGAVLDIFFDGFQSDQIIDLWRIQARGVLDAIGWNDQSLIERTFEGGINLALSAPLDQLYSATFAAQTAWHFCAGQLLNVETGDFAGMIEDLRVVMAREANSALLAIVEQAREQDVEVLVDDDHLSIGHGFTSQVWSVLQLPKQEEIDWSTTANVPLALITGTNGKTTTTRLSCAIARAAGKVAGLTSTDFVSVGDDVLDLGDYSGPGGARLLLRDPRVEMAYLEVARGGILRRGLPVLQARVALITNVAADHLGQYGVNTVEELAVAKFSIHRALAREGVLILNADDPYVKRQAAQTPGKHRWFSISPDAPHIVNALTTGTPCAWLDDSTIMLFDGHHSAPVCEVGDIPITMNGAAEYNVMNALGAVCLSHAMGIDQSAIRAGLRGFENDPKDNPGRCNEFEVNGARVFVDFAHNPHSIQAVVATMTAIAANRRFIMLSHAGDRSDQDVRDVTASALAMNPDYVVATELPDHLRGRESGEVSSLIRRECSENGLKPDQIISATSPIDAARKILVKLQPGDLALLLVLSDRDQVFELLAR